MLFWLTLLETLPRLDLQDSARLEPACEVAFAEENSANTSPAYSTAIAQLQPAQTNLVESVSNNSAFIVVFWIVFGLIAFGAILALIRKFYKITPTNEAFVITGLFSKKKSVVLNGGCMIIPGFQEYTRVPLKEISIDVERTGKLAVRTQDYLRADMKVTFFVCINASEDDIFTAAARLSNEGQIQIENIKKALENRADDAIRAAAKTKALAEIDSDKLGFAQEVLNLIGPDLKKVGLTLNSIAISEIGESDTYTNDFFDAQGVRLRTETIQKSIKQKREVELTTQIEIEQKEVEAEKISRQIANDNERDKLERQLAIEAERAQREREIQEAKDREMAAIERSKILQEKAVEEEKIKNKLAVQQSQIEADIALEERNKHLKVAQAVQQQEAEMAEINRQKGVQQSQIEADIELEEQRKRFRVAQALQQQDAEIAEVQRQQQVDSARLQSQVEVAESERSARIAQEDAAIAIANKERERSLAEAQRVKAEADVATAKAIAEAQRQQQLAEIDAEREAQQHKIGEQNVVEIEAYRRRRQAEAAQQAAEMEAESIRTLAEANREKALVEAEGLREKIAAENAISDAKLKAEVIQAIAPMLVDKLPAILQALAPQPGVLGDPKVYLFPGSNGSNDMGEFNKILLSTSGLSLINAFLEEGKLEKVLGLMGNFIGKNDSTGNSGEKSDSEAMPKPPKSPATPARSSEPIPPGSTSAIQQVRKPGSGENNVS
ncbi:SPFH domain-containing protein [Phormidium sp. CCY1219]|uniref:SPFH domain-containing protein n=1 Tax=Phormidium sp. CCY1219 TaxID=2886104 RepID=UPI002D1F8F05|nr:SPFH domain-containing protein [Phormidium sp. CCY1219]MEB3830407.1 flotillin family protein [Phormidium sp. CCY1219]